MTIVGRAAENMRTTWRGRGTSGRGRIGIGIGIAIGMTKRAGPDSGLGLGPGSEDTGGVRGRQTRGTERGEIGTATATVTAIVADPGTRNETAGGGVEMTMASGMIAALGTVPTGGLRGPRPNPTTDKA
jgi:hypothetical protein